MSIGGTYDGKILPTSVTLCALWGLGPLHPCDERTAENTGMMRKSVVLPGEAGYVQLMSLSVSRASAVIFDPDRDSQK